MQILPMHKVKRLIKSENSVKAVSGEASFAIAKATVSLKMLAGLGHCHLLTSTCPQ